MAGLTQSGAGATTPSNPDFRFALHTRQGVADLSGVGSEMGKQVDIGIAKAGVEEFGDVVAKGYEGYIKADLTNKINEEAISPFLESRGMSPTTGSQETDAINSKAASAAEVQQKEPGVYNDIKKLAASFKQGRITQNQLEINIRAVTKAAVAKNPGFMKQLIDHAQHVEFLSGVRLLGDPKEEIDKEAAKQKQDIKKDIFDRAKTNGVVYDSFRMDDEIHQRETLQQVMEKETQNAIFAASKQQGESIDREDKYIGKQAEALVPTWRQGSMNNFVQGMNNLIEIAGETPNKQVQQDIIQQLTGLSNQHKAMLSNEMNIRKVSAPIANQQYKQHSEALDAMAKVAIDRISGNTTADMYKNDVSVMDNHLKMQSLSVVNPHNAKALRDLNLGVPGMVDAIMSNPNAQFALTTGAQDLLNGLSSQNSSDLLTKRTLGKNTTDCGVYLENCMNKIASGDEGVMSTSSQMLSGIAAITVDLKDKMQGMDINQRIEAQRNIVNVIGMSKYKDVQVMDEEGKRHAHNITTDFMQYAGRAFNQRTEALRSDGYNINTEFGPTGQMIITSPDAPKQIVDDLNRKYASAWNSGVKSMANIYKNSWKDASGMIVDLQGSTWGIAPGTNPIAGAVPQEAQKKSRTTLEPELRSFAVDEANKAGLDPSLVLRVIQQESGGDVGATSKKGAKGLMQLMPTTARELGVNENDPHDNIRGGIKYLKQQMDKYGDPRLALAAYNAGPGAVDKHKGIPPFKETQDYVSSILGE